MKKITFLVLTIAFATVGYAQPEFTTQTSEQITNLEIQFVDDAGNDLIVFTPKEGNKFGSRKIEANTLKTTDFKVVFRDTETKKEYEPTFFIMIIVPVGDKPYQYEIIGNKIEKAYLNGITPDSKISFVKVTVKGDGGQTYTSPVGYTVTII